MTIIKLLYFKYSISFFICLISSFIIFFIFSLFANLNEDYLFNTIIKLSLLNSLQILTYVPAFIFLISVILFTIFLRSKNEIIIIKGYLNIKKLMLFFLPIVIFFTILEINKKNYSLFFEDSKANLLDQKNKYPQRILIDEKNNIKTITVLNNINAEDLKSIEYRSYKIYNKKINEAQFTNNLIISNNILIAENHTQYKDNLIKDYNFRKSLDLNLLQLIKHSSIVKDLTKNNNFNLNLETINLFIFFSLFFAFIFLIFSNKKFVNSKENLYFPIFFCLVILMYSFFIFNNSLSLYKQELEVLGSLIIGMLVFKEKLNE